MQIVGLRASWRLVTRARAPVLLWRPDLRLAARWPMGRRGCLTWLCYRGPKGSQAVYDTTLNLGSPDPLRSLAPASSSPNTPDSEHSAARSGREQPGRKPFCGSPGRAFLPQLWSAALTRPQPISPSDQNPRHSTRRSDTQTPAPTWRALDSRCTSSPSSWSCPHDPQTPKPPSTFSTADTSPPD